MSKMAVYRIRKDVPGVGRRLANFFNGQRLTSLRPHGGIEEGTTIINYGRSTRPDWFDKVINHEVRLLNLPEAVANAVNKLVTLRLLKEAGISCLEHTVDPNEAEKWLSTGDDVVVRHKLMGKKGNGIQIIRCDDGDHSNHVPDAPLYTKLYNKTHEFRVHVFNGKVIDYVQKKRMGKKKRELHGLVKVDENIRNHKRGWVFGRKDIIHSQEMKDACVKAVQVLGLDFGAVDVLAKVDESGKLYDFTICEVNSAPGMSDKNTFKAYTDAIAAIL